MIPLKLELTNFLSYRQQAELDFHGIHLACISGANGSGKSSILDAITWALFGQSRSRSDDDVVNRVAAMKGEEASVNLSFEFEGNSYRVIRRKKARKTMLLEFQIATADGNWKPLSEGRLRDTQRAVESLLNMNFDTFINASFLLQGKADEFTTKTASQRKEILAELLGVTLWNHYRQLASRRRQTTEDELYLIDGRLREIEEELNTRPEREAALASATENLERLSAQLNSEEKLLKELRNKQAVIEQQKQTVKNLESNLGRASRLLEQSQRNLQRQRDERDKSQAILDDALTIEARYAVWKGADEALARWQAKADQYHRLQQQRRPYELELTGERGRLTQRKQELTGQANQVATLREERSTVADKVERVSQALKGLESELADLSAKEKLWRQAQSELQQVESDRKLLQQEAGQLRDRHKRVVSLDDQRPTVEANLKEARLALEAVDSNLAAVDENRQIHSQASVERQSLESEQSRLKAEMNDLKERLDKLSAEVEGLCPLCGQLLTEEHRQQVLGELKAEGETRGDRYRENDARVQELEQQISSLQGKVKQKDRLEREQRALQQRIGAAETQLENIEKAVVEWEAEGAGRLAELEKLLADDVAIRKLSSKEKELAQAVQDKGKREQEYKQQQNLVSESRARLGEIDRVLAEWEDETQGKPAELATVSRQLELDEYGHEARAALAELDRQLAEVGYDPDAHQDTKAKRDSLADAQSRYQELARAQSSADLLDRNLAELEEQVAAQQQNESGLREQLSDAQSHLASLAEGAADPGDLESVVFELRERKNAANRHLARAEQNVEVLEELSQRHEQLLGQREQTALQIKRLKVLEQACGRDGVQALLIERALPEIEDDANLLLDRLTGGRMRVTFETQRKLKTSERLAETLEIQIEDSEGQRPYENFSGGEQFRVDFAVRLALSKLLTRRSGTRLQTLVIDEGFGSQDLDGQQRLIEAINTIQNDFERILVITHIDSLREAFPTLIEVEKGSRGSTIQVR